MSFVIFNSVSGRLYRKPQHVTNMQYETEQGAKSACTRLNKKDALMNPWRVMTSDEWCARPVKMVERVNLMSGLTFMEAEDTPNFCSPASESYWSQ